MNWKAAGEATALTVGTGLLILGVAVVVAVAESVHPFWATGVIFAVGLTVLWTALYQMRK